MSTFRMQLSVVGLLLFMSVLFLVPFSASAKKSSHEFGDVPMNRYMTKQNKFPVIFRHWVHRSKHSCRLCHVDIEFSMVAGETDITEEDNRAGRYCGACHNEKTKEAFPITECEKCHPKDFEDMKAKGRAAKKAFYQYKKSLPKSIYGNKIDWTMAEDMGLVKAKNYIKGLTFSNKKMANLRDEPQTPKLQGLPGIIFSHKKHVAWAGCGECHPEHFALETGKTKMTMKEITNGKFCGVCHTSVAFPLNDCSKCHSGDVLP